MCAGVDDFQDRLSSKRGKIGMLSIVGARKMGHLAVLLLVCI